MCEPLLETVCEPILGTVCEPILGTGCELILGTVCAQILDPIGSVKYRLHIQLDPGSRIYISRSILLCNN